MSGYRIVLDIHCATCGSDQLHAGFTVDGLQIWCDECRAAVLEATPRGLKQLLRDVKCADCGGTLAEHRGVPHTKTPH